MGDTKRLFSDAARTAAKASRLRNAQAKAEVKAQGNIEVFAVRAVTGYTWQARKFGGLVLGSGVAVGITMTADKPYRTV